MAVLYIIKFPCHQAKRLHAHNYPYVPCNMNGREKGEKSVTPPLISLGKNSLLFYGTLQQSSIYHKDAHLHSTFNMKRSSPNAYGSIYILYILYILYIQAYILYIYIYIQALQCLMNKTTLQPLFLVLSTLVFIICYTMAQPVLINGLINQ